MHTELKWSTELTDADYTAMAELFDSEYAADWGPWSPRAGYGYAPGELHALTRIGDLLIGYAATARRIIRVGNSEVIVAGTGGVMTLASARGQGIGTFTLSALQDANRSFAPADFGLLGCREEVVPFYESCGYARVDALIRDVSPRMPAPSLKVTARR